MGALVTKSKEQHSEPSSNLTSSSTSIALVLEFGYTLQTLKVDAVTLEGAINCIIKHLKLEGSIFATPTGLLISLRKIGHHSKTYLLRVESSKPNLTKLTKVEALIENMLQNKVDVISAYEQLIKLNKSSVRFGLGLRIFANGLVSMGFAIMLKGNLYDAAFGFGIGIIIGLITNLVDNQKRLASLIPFIGGVVSSLTSSLIIKNTSLSLHYPIILISGVIWLIPGLDLLVSMQELGTGNVVSGTTRMASTALGFSLLAFGIDLGKRLSKFWYTKLPKLQLIETTIVDTHCYLYILFALSIVTFAYVIIFQGRFRDYIWIVLVSILTWYCSSYFTNILTSESLSSGITAFILGTICNYYGRISHNPESILLLPALMVILPGVLGIQGLTSLISDDNSIFGLHQSLQLISSTMALMLGLLIANIVVVRRTFQ